MNFTNKQIIDFAKVYYAEWKEENVFDVLEDMREGYCGKFRNIQDLADFMGIELESAEADYFTLDNKHYFCPSAIEAAND